MKTKTVTTTDAVGALHHGLRRRGPYSATLHQQRGRVVIERRDCDRHGPSLKPTRAILLCPWERHFTAHYLDWWSWQAVLD